MVRIDSDSEYLLIRPYLTTDVVVWLKEEPGLDIHSVLQLMQQFDEAAVSGQALQLPLRVGTLSPPKMARFVHENRLLVYVVVPAKDY